MTRPSPSFSRAVFNEAPWPFLEAAGISACRRGQSLHPEQPPAGSHPAARFQHLPWPPLSQECLCPAGEGGQGGDPGEVAGKGCCATSQEKHCKGSRRGVIPTRQSLLLAPHRCDPAAMGGCTPPLPRDQSCALFCCQVLSAEPFFLAQTPPSPDCISSLGCAAAQEPA